jgi:hypothetical protein
MYGVCPDASTKRIWTRTDAYGFESDDCSSWIPMIYHWPRSTSHHGRYSRFVGYAARRPTPTRLRDRLSPHGI